MEKVDKIEFPKAIAKLAAIKTSVQKLNLVAELIRGMKADMAVVQLTFNNKKVSKDVKNCLLSAIANAENNLNLDIDSLYVSKVLVGKAFTMRRFSARAKGRGTRIMKPFSRLTIELEQR
jgi:large subunit ribosomal protein L22